MGVTIIMKKKFVKTLSLGICFIMFSFVSAHTPKTNIKVIIPISTHELFNISIQDPPFL